MLLLNNSTFYLIFKTFSDCEFLFFLKPHTFVDHHQKSIVEWYETDLAVQWRGRYIGYTECCGVVYMEHTRCYQCKDFCDLTCLFLHTATIRCTFPLAPHCRHFLWPCPSFSTQMASFGTSCLSPALVIHPRRSLFFLCTGSTCHVKFCFCPRGSFRCLHCNKWLNRSCCFLSLCSIFAIQRSFFSYWWGESQSIDCSTTHPPVKASVPLAVTWTSAATMELKHNQ